MPSDLHMKKKARFWKGIRFLLTINESVDIRTVFLTIVAPYIAILNRLGIINKYEYLLWGLAQVGTVYPGKTKTAQQQFFG